MAHSRLNGLLLRETLSTGTDFLPLSFQRYCHHIPTPCGEGLIALLPLVELNKGTDLSVEVLKSATSTPGWVMLVPAEG